MNTVSERDKAYSRFKKAQKNVELIRRLRPTFIDCKAMEQELVDAAAAIKAIEAAC